MTPSLSRPDPTLADRLVDLALRGAIGAALAMPYPRRVAFFGGVARQVAGPLAGYRRRALSNLALVRPDWPEVLRHRVAEQALDNFGRTLIENYSWRELSERLRQAPVTGGGLPHLEEARAQGRPVILVTGHFGNHEAPRHALAHRGFRIGGLYREMGNPLVNRHYVATMAEVSGPVFPKGRRGTLGFVRHLAGGGMATILFDLHDRGGAPIPFLGRPALTALTAAELALRYDALLVPYWGIRRNDGLGFEVAVEEPIPRGPALAMMEEATRRLEARVLAHPEQWFWVHRRWKGTAP
jgi:KDO2-lipid IV(A) lauroyltransferase